MVEAMSKYKFVKTPSTDEDSTTVTVETSDVQLEHLLWTIGDFLRGCGFSFKGRLEIVEDEE